jgi:hypothetical protein
MKTKKIMVALLALGAYFSGNAQSWSLINSSAITPSPVGAWVGLGSYRNNPITPISGFHLQAPDYAGSTVTIERTNGYTPSLVLKTSTTTVLPTPNLGLLSGVIYGQIVFTGANGGTIGTATSNYGAYIAATTTEQWTPTANGTKLDFYTTKNQTKTVVSALTLNQDGSTSVNGNLMAVGTVGIGIAPQTGYSLAVNGGIVATSVKVEITSGGIFPDYVFKKDYNLRSLKEVEAYVNANSHLPEVPSAAEVAKSGINVADMDATLLKKVEELTLYMIQQQKEIEALKLQVSSK